jgi:protease II
MDNFNDDYAWLRAGNWLNRSIIPPIGESGQLVRERQFSSALTALKLLGAIDSASLDLQTNE